MKIFFDTEFIEDGKTIDLLSIGAVREDGAVFYAESAEADPSKASEWVRANVLPHLLGGAALFSRRGIAASFEVFCGEQPELWAYYADYDWVVLCQLYGTMMDLPKSWPMFCRDVKQLCMDRGNPELPPKGDRPVHHALTDAKWTREAWEFLSALPEVAPIAAEQRKRGLTPEMVAEHYPQTQHQPDECEICHFVFKVAAEALRSPLAEKPAP